VGGIYTVIRSKAFVSTEEMGDNYCLFGPYKEYYARQEVELGDFPAGSPLQVAANRLREQGFGVTLTFPFTLTLKLKKSLVEGGMRKSLTIGGRGLGEMRPLARGRESSGRALWHWDCILEIKRVEAAAVG